MKDVVDVGLSLAVGYLGIVASVIEPPLPHQAVLICILLGLTWAWRYTLLRHIVEIVSFLRGVLRCLVVATTLRQLPFPFEQYRILVLLLDLIPIDPPVIPTSIL
jgi:hypothetical protein